MGEVSKIKTYRDLLVWQKAMTMVTDVYQTVRSFPKDEIYGLSAQIRRCAVSVPSNIAEGYGRNSTQDYIRFLQVACGSLFELQTQLEIAANLGYMEQDHFQELFSTSRETERMLSSLIRKVGASR